MAQLRLSPSGPVIAGENPGDVLIWDGDEWNPGPNPANGPTFHARSFQSEGQLATLAVVDASVLQFSAGEWAIGQAVFVQSVIQFSGSSSGALQYKLWWSGDGVDWEPFWQPTELNVGFSEGSKIDIPIQGETPMIDENWESPNVFVAVAAGVEGEISATISLGHIQAQMFTPLPEAEE